MSKASMQGRREQVGASMLAMQAQFKAWGEVLGARFSGLDAQKLQTEINTHRKRLVDFFKSTDEQADDPVGLDVRSPKFKKMIFCLNCRLP
jgi:hypothetical protein